jgi:hypothetical protein
MPILDLQQRLRELGRIRIGQKVPTASGKSRPAKLDRFRLTSPSRPLLDKVAARYGGTVAAWTPDGGAAQFEVVTDAVRLPILVPNQPVSQYYELWSGGGCQRRCDGITELLSDRACPCGPDPQRRQCKPTTRLSVVLAEIEGVGVWRLETHGYYAALELPGVAELLSRSKDYVPAFLGLEERTAKRDGKTLRWMVPTIDVEITPTALAAGQITGAPPAVASGPERVAITGGRPDYAALAAAAATADGVKALWTQANQAGHLDDALAATLKARAAALGAPAKPPTGQGMDLPHPEDVQRQLNPADYGDAPPAPVPDEDGVYDGEIVDEPDPAAAQDLWFQIIAAAGAHGLTTAQVEGGFAQRHGGMHPSSGSVAQLQTYLAAVKAGEVA